jgi:hypothetical protein
VKPDPERANLDWLLLPLKANKRTTRSPLAFAPAVSVFKFRVAARAYQRGAAYAHWGAGITRSLYGKSKPHIQATSLTRYDVTNALFHGNSWRESVNTYGFRGPDMLVHTIKPRF